MNELEPSVSRGSRFSAVWIIPLVALVIGVSMVVHTFMTEGPTITIDFATAEGLEKGLTNVRLLNVDIGRVENVELKGDVSGVTATIKLERSAAPLLRQDTRFWVVRARVNASGISGLGTLLGGSYIEMAPGDSDEESRTFIGLEEPPLTPIDAPGLRLRLISQNAGSISTGDPVLYQGYPVGRIESTQFDTDQRQALYDVFIDAPFHQLIDSSTRFWDTSGISIKASAEGLEISTGSLDTTLRGGVAFSSPPGLPAGYPVENGKQYQLYESYDNILKNPYQHGIYYVVSFRQSVRGLAAGAPVEYHGIKLGRVERILLKELMKQGTNSIGKALPVLIYLEPGQLALPDTAESVITLKEIMKEGVANGLRATLQTGNLLTGQQLISLDFYPEEEPAELSQFEQYTRIPTIETGVARLEEQVRVFLDTLNALPLNDTVVGVNQVVSDANKAVLSLTTTLNAANSLLDSNDPKALPAGLTATLDELRRTLAGLSPESNMYQNLESSMSTLSTTLDNLDTLLRELSDKPNALVLPSTHKPDLIPKAGSR